MADEQQTPEEENVVEEVAEEVHEEIEESVEDALEVTEELSETAPAEAVDEAIVSTMETMDEVASGSHDPAGEHHFTDEVVLPYFGSIGTMPGGIYTFIFGVLAAITLVEVIITVLLPENGFTIAILVLLSLSKAYLVVMFYMHLNRDNPIFRLAIILPLLIVLLSTLYLLGVPSTPGLGYN